jgi:hypothetical protein
MSVYNKIVLGEPVDRASVAAINLFWLGFLIYVVSYTISATDEVNYVVCNVFQLLGLFLLLPSSAILIYLKIENSFLRIMFFTYILWQVATVIRGFEFDYEVAKQLLFDPNSGAFLYLAPVIMLIPVNINFLKKIFQVIIVLSIFFIFYDIIFIRQLVYPSENMRSQAMIEYFTQQLSLCGGFLLLTYFYSSRKANLFILFTMAVTFLLAVIRARRGLIFMTFSMLFFSYLIYHYINKTKVVNMVLSLFLITIITFVAIRVYNENRKDTFSLITERINQRTRSEVVKYFYRDMQAKDWIIGKGLNGEYFCPGVTEGVGRITIYRRVVETGYLQVILNGGLISLVLLLLIAIPGMVRGIFYSKNILSKAAGIWIFLFLLFMYPGTITKFSMHYLLVWISIGICYSNQICSLPDETIREMFTSKQKNVRQNQQ